MQTREGHRVVNHVKINRAAVLLAIAGPTVTGVAACGNDDGPTGALKAYQEQDSAAADEQVRESYSHMFATGDPLAGGIARQSPEKLGG